MLIYTYSFFSYYIFIYISRFTVKTSDTDELLTEHWADIGLSNILYHFAWVKDFLVIFFVIGSKGLIELIWLMFVCLSSVSFFFPLNFSFIPVHFFQNHWVNFKQDWHKAFLLGGIVINGSLLFWCWVDNWKIGLQIYAKLAFFPFQLFPSYDIIFYSLFYNQFWICQ